MVCEMRCGVECVACADEEQHACDVEMMLMRWEGEGGHTVGAAEGVGCDGGGWHAC